MRPQLRHANRSLNRSTVAACIVVAGHFFVLPLESPAGSEPPASTTQPTRRVNVQNLAGQPFAPAIFWFGKVGMTSNYADVRVWHYDNHLKIVVHIMDRLLFYDPSPDPSQLTAWDAVSLYVDVAGNSASTPATTSNWFVKQLSNADSPNSRAGFQGTGSGWVPSAAAFTASDGWRGNYPNDTVWDDGWMVEFTIPFASLGLAGAPPPGTVWGLGVAVHDRDDAAGTPIAAQAWPEGFESLSPATWGQMHFGQPPFTPAAKTASGTTVVRHGLNGAVVPDAAVGGHTICGGSMNAWTEWGAANYAGYTQFNIQNQWDISDFMCFSKYYVTFPLTGVPAGAGIVSARVKLSLFGNAGYNPGDAQVSAINALTVSEDWTEGAITWNNAPRATENVSVTWVHPVSDAHPPGPYYWDVSRAVAEARQKGQPLRLVFYSTDGEYHSGKYFWTSDSDDWGGTVRPTLEVQWGGVAPVLAPLETALKVGATNTLTGSGFTAGSVVKLFVSTETGVQAFGPYSPTSQTSTSLSWAIPNTVPLGNGFGSVQVVNTDTGYQVSNTVGTLLEGDPSDNIPTIMYLNGSALGPADPSIGVAHVDTVVAKGGTVTITGTGFSTPGANLFTAAGNVGPLWPVGGWSATQFQVQVPVSAPTGPGNFQVVNSPYTGNVASNAVSAVIGAPPTITAVNVVGTTVTVTGTGFCAMSVVNLFNKQGATVVNLGGLNGTTAKIPVTVVNDTQFTFAVPAGAVAGPAFIEVLNPPYIPFSSSGADPDGAFTLPS